MVILSILLVFLVALNGCCGLKTLAITGAAGRVGRQLINEIILKDFIINGEKIKVKALVRDRNQLKDVEGKVEVVEVLFKCPQI